ncbi:Pyridinium-3,5-biscarboxylic acid mononucleotide sulfurtransferase [bioreactor metagenome]|uniref:Pyridinium-3,5-biscarboxylic acid mononucleotide sulfurtransferase n=1 Tax=bioreactor metagenome TaxID=1076179 RepID=A0A645CP86_9ZZZZ
MLNLATWDKPSFACLASRIPYGEPITKEKLAMIEKAELFLMAQGFKQLRVRCHDKLARIEVLEEDIPLLLNSEIREKTAEAFAKIGFIYTAIDIKGYRTGSLNELLKQ